ncbi:hypothetical protein KNG_18290 [Burkholderia pseudomallei]|nr:hypothetical protein KNG_18290 [Burkholderia pseudomallei]
MSAPFSAPPAHGRDARRNQVEREPAQFGRRGVIAAQIEQIAGNLAHGQAPIQWKKRSTARARRERRRKYGPSNVNPPKLDG